MTKTIASVLFLCTISIEAFAQSPGGIINRVQNFFHFAFAKSAQSRWSNLPENEYTCVDQKLQKRGGSLKAIISQGIFPNNRLIAKLRAECRASVTSQQLQRLENQAFRRSGQDKLIAAANYDECENACRESSSCAAITFFRAQKLCRIMRVRTGLETDDGADSAYRIESVGPNAHNEPKAIIQ